MSSYEIFRQNVKARLAELEWTQRDLAAELGVTASYVTHLLNGQQRHGINLTTLDSVASAVDLSAAELLTAS
jgi:transcriptional regulator with XRE-family HTH domain